MNKNLDKVNNLNTNKPGNLILREFDGDIMKHYNLNMLVKTIYKNFLYLSKKSELKHNKDEIMRLLKSSKTISYFLYNGNTIIGYVIGEVMRLNDGRLVLYISYIYIAKKYRNKGLGSTLLKQITFKAKELHLDAVLLTRDTNDKRVYEFYLQKGFTYDPYLRRYSRYDVLCLSLE
jgi:ribosomal protein S18 acetylase RimI-like enzyme